MLTTIAPKTTGKIFVSIDIETTGPLTWRDSVVSVGFFIGDDAGNELDVFRVNFDVDWPVFRKCGHCGSCDSPITYGDFDKQCWDEFWSKQPIDMIEACKADARPGGIGWSAIYAYLRHLNKKYGDDIVFVTDNPSFDIAFLDHNLTTNCTLSQPIRYSTITGAYRQIMVSDDMFGMIPDAHRDQAMARIKMLVQPDHNPVNDAHFNYLQVIEALRWKRKLDASLQFSNSNPIGLD